MNDQPIDLERERRIRRKIRSLGESIEAADETDELADDPEGYLKRKAEPMNDDQKPMYSVRDVAELFDVDPESVRRWIRSGDLQASKVGRGYRVSRADLEAFYRSKGGGNLFKEPIKRFAVVHEDSPGAMKPVNANQKGFINAIDSAKQQVAAGQGPVRVEVYRLQDRQSRERPDFEIVFYEGGFMVYRLDWTEAPTADRQSIRTEVSLETMLAESGLEWPEVTGG